MSKRTNEEAKSTNTSKKPKLASIFAPPPTPSASTSSTSTFKKSIIKTTTSSNKIKKELTQLESDELFARGLLKSDELELKNSKKQGEKLKVKGSSIKKEVNKVDSDSDDDDIIIIEPTTSTSSLPIASTSTIIMKTTPKKQSTTQDIKPILSSTNSSFFTSSKSPSKPSTSTYLTPSKSLDTPLHSFNPKEDINTSNWPLDNNSKKRVPYSFLVQAFVLISSTKSRLKILNILTNLFRSIIELDSNSLLINLYLLQGKLGPTHSEENFELGIGSLVLRKSILETSGMSSSALSSLSKKLGDPGDLAFEAKSSIRLLIPPPPLVCHSLYNTLLSLSKLSGTGSQATKTAIVKKLLISAQGEESRFLVRTLISNLRIGAVRTTLTTALARAFCWSRCDDRLGEEVGEFWVSDEERKIMREEADEEEEGGKKKKKGKGKGKAKVLVSSPSKSNKGKEKAKSKAIESDSDAEEDELNQEEEDDGEAGEIETVQQRVIRAENLVKQVWAQHPDYSHIVTALLSAPLAQLPTLVPLQIGTPLQPMLGSITRSLSEVYERLGTKRSFVSEAKLDGQRGQIHVSLDGPPSGVDEKGEKVEGGEGGSGGRWFEWSEEGEKGEKRKRRVWIRLFSRHLLDQTVKYPDLFPTLAELITRSESLSFEGIEPIRNFIIDAEIVAIDPLTGEFKTFTELSHRSKKDVEIGDIKIRVGCYAFDLMFLNGKSLLAEPFRIRRNLLRSLFKPLSPLNPTSAKWELVPTCEDNNPEAVQKFFQDCLKIRCEGIMVKLLDHAVIDSTTPEQEDDEEAGESSTTKIKKKSRRKILPASYEPDKRADSWLKVKKDYLDDLGDSLDLVPIGVWHGSGRKKDWWSPILLGCYDDQTGTYQAVTKIISGFKDDFYKSLSLRYQKGGENTSNKCYPNVDAGSVRPDLWLLPSEVWEIRCADISLSPVYPAAMGLISDERGISIRFPRFIKIRDPEDKGVEDATSSSQLADLFRNQGDKGGKVDNGDQEEEEVDVDVEEEEVEE